MIIVITSILLVLCIASLAFYFFHNSQNQRKKRLMSVVHGAGVGGNGSKSALSPDQRRAELAKKLKDGHPEEKADGQKSTLGQKLVMAGLKIGIKEFWMFSLLSGVALAILAFLVNGSPLVCIMAFITGLLGLPKVVLNFMVNHRQKRFMDDLADALESMQRLLKAGMPVSECIKMVAREFSGPVGEEMGKIFDQQKIGIPLPEATLEAAKRMPIPEMQMFATAIAIQTQTGSSLSEVLENLAGVIRARFRLKRKVKALSSEAKASAAIIGSLPILVGVGMYFLNNAYVMVLLTEGKHLMAIAVGWMMIGIFVMRQMINFKV